MTKLELLNVFLTDRLTAAAEEIFRAVKDTLLGYQSELLCAKKENERLQRLLNVAVQRLLLQPEPPSVQPPEEAQPCESDRRSSVEPLPQIKEEPKPGIDQTDDSQEERDSDEGQGGGVEVLAAPRPPAAQTLCSRQSVSPPALLSQEIKAESEGGDSGNLTDSPPSSYSNRREARSDVCSSTEQSRNSNPQVRGLLCTNGKQNVHTASTKNTRSVKPPPPRPSFSSQNVQRWHSCKECGKGFSFACQLEVHMRWHTKEKPYGCTVCRKSFTTVSMLKRHHRIHTGEKPFHCHVCGKRFNQSAHLNTHFRLHTREGQLESSTTHPVSKYS